MQNYMTAKYKFTPIWDILYLDVVKIQNTINPEKFVVENIHAKKVHVKNFLSKLTIDENF